MQSVAQAQRTAARIAIAKPLRSHRLEMVGGAVCAGEVARREGECGVGAERVLRVRVGLLIVRRLADRVRSAVTFQSLLPEKGSTDLC